MDNKFVIENYWGEHELNISNEYGFNQFSITDFIKSATDSLLLRGYKKILDLGCGSGRHTIYLNKKGFYVYASDTDCRIINENIKRLNLTNVKIREHSFTQIPYPNEFFDVAISTSTLHHAILKDVKKGINEVYRVLKPNGYFIFDTLSKEDDSYGLGNLQEDNTFVGSREGEENIPHHYTDERELEVLLNLFSNINIKKSIYTCNNVGRKKYISKTFDIFAIK